MYMKYTPRIRTSQSFRRRYTLHIIYIYIKPPPQPGSKTMLNLIRVGRGVFPKKAHTSCACERVFDIGWFDGQGVDHERPEGWGLRPQAGGRR